MPDAIHKKHCHANSDEIYYIISGHGLAGAGSDRVEVHGGHFHFIPNSHVRIMGSHNPYVAVDHLAKGLYFFNQLFYYQIVILDITSSTNVVTTFERLSPGTAWGRKVSCVILG